MDRFETDMEEEDQPLDLSMKPRSFEVNLCPGRVDEGPPNLPPRMKSHGEEEVALCLIKDCGCNRHGPRSRVGTIYESGKYGAPVVDVEAGRGLMVLGGESREVRSEERCVIDTAHRYPDYERACATKVVESSWEGQRFVHNRERMDTSFERTRFENSSQTNYETPYRTCGTESGNNGANFRHSQKAFDAFDQNIQSFADLNNSRCNSDTSIWRPPLNNEERNLSSCRPWSEGSNNPSTWNWSSRGWNRSESYPSQDHWRPFADKHSEHVIPREKPSYNVVQKLANTEADSSSQPSKPYPAEVPPAIVTPSPPSKDQAKAGSVRHSFATTVPLITSSSAVPLRREAQALSSSARNSDSSTASRRPYTTIRVTRSPKTFHNESIRVALDADNHGASPFKRPQDASRRLPGKSGSQEKENIDVDRPEGVKMPALDYLISKVLVERIDIPFKPCNTEIKKIYNGESKGKLRLVDLIELQVEESLKA